MQPFKEMVLKMDHRATAKKDGEQWQVFDGAGVMIGYTKPSYERRSSYAWMRAYWELERRTRRVDVVVVTP